MGGKLAANVAVHDGPTTTWYAAGDSPSAAHAKLITNPKAWEGGKPPKAGGESSGKSADSDSSAEGDTT